MEDLILKITEIDKTSISFKCILEGSDYHIDDMPSYRFDLCDFEDVDSVDELIKRVSVSAFTIAQQQKARELIMNSPVAQLDLSPLLDKEIIMTAAEAYSSDNFQVTHD